MGLKMSYAVAVDIGGTFTDLVAYDHATRRVIYSKSPTTYSNLSEGILDCFSKARVTPDEVTFLSHGTTLVINAFIQRNGARAAIVTSAGFRDLLEIARGNRPDPFDLQYQRDEPLIPRELRFEVPERLDANGEVVTPLDLNALEHLSEKLRELQVESVAVFFMNSFLNSAHEEVATATLKRLLPGVYITHSTELTRERYEYERCSTVAANAFVGPQVSKYVRQLEGDLKGQGFDGSLFMMGSNGGLLSVDRTCRQPIGLVESGPIGGCIGASAYADYLGFKNVVAFDMGGTTAKCALIDNGQFSVESTYYANGYVRGFPIKSPVINIVEVGSGGGSIAWLDSQKRLHIGPRSAGSMPGPVSYARGGTEPTVTDAHLVLGRLNANRFLGGEMKLDVDAAKNAILKSIAEPLGYQGADGIVKMADGILSIATVVMAGAIRQVSIEHGLDPRDFVLITYGGCGPLHASALAHELSIPMVVIPPAPGNFSAIGMLLADARLDESKTFIGDLDEMTARSVSQVFGEMEAAARSALEKEFGAQEVLFEHHVEMRYRGQRHNIKVPIVKESDHLVIRQAFERDYKRRYGHVDNKAVAEFQAVHLSAFARQRRPDLAYLPQKAESPPAPYARPVYFGNTGKVIETQCFDRYSLPPGFAGEGPAILEEYGSTTVVPPGDRYEIGAMHEIRIHC